MIINFLVEFFTKNVFQSLLRGRETFEKKYWVVFKVSRKNQILFSKNRKNPEKNEIVRNFLTKIKFDFFVDFFTKNVFKSLLWGRETFEKKY